MKLPNYEDEYLIFGLLFMLGNRLQVICDNFYDEITAKQWFVLATLKLFEDNYPTLNELSEAVGSSHQNVKQLILKLEQKGYVRLYVDQKDRRKSRVMMTEKYDEINQKYKEKQNMFMKSLFKGIGPGTLKSAVKAYVKLKENMEMMK